MLAALLLSWFYANEKFGFVLTASIAGAAIMHTAKITRRRATIDLIMKTENDRAFQKTLRRVMQIKDAELGLLAVKARDSVFDGVNDPTEEERKKMTDIHVVAGWYEFVATGIREAAFDFKIFRRLYCSLTVKDYERLRAFITQLNEHKDDGKTYYQEFAWLYKQLKNHPLEECK